MNRRAQPQHDYHGVIRIPEGACGTFRVKHDHRPADTTFKLTTLRTAFTAGHHAPQIHYGFPTVWHELLEGEGRWMSDWPIEQWQMLQTMKPIQRGSVLIGGLGLGVCTTQLARRRGITKITVIERAPEVIELVWPHLLIDDPKLRAKVTVVQSDLLDYLNALPPASESFTWAFYDTWVGDGEAVFHEEVVPLLQASAIRVRQRPLCWNEDVMRGQLYRGLETKLLCASEQYQATFKDIAPTLETLATVRGSIWTDWSVPFFRWALREQEAGREPRKAPGPHGTTAHGYYANLYGLPGWERAWEGYAQAK